MLKEYSKVGFVSCFRSSNEVNMLKERNAVQTVFVNDSIE